MTIAELLAIDLNAVLNRRGGHARACVSGGVEWIGVKLSVLDAETRERPIDAARLLRELAPGGHDYERLLAVEKDA